ncbi:MAG: PAS domain S-box protein [bacterium]|nr:PAS domain S-box protein [bacterium]
MSSAADRNTDADPGQLPAGTTISPGSKPAPDVAAFRLTGDGFVQVFRSSPAGMLISTVDDGTLLDVNDSFVAMSGFRRDELLGRSAVDLGMWARPEQRDRLISALRQGGSVRNVESEFRTKSGEPRVGLISADLVEINDRPCMFCVCIDITQRRLAEKVLQQERDLITAILDTSGALVIVLDTEGRVARFNSACERCTGYTFEELRNTHFWERLLVPEAVEQAKQVFEDLRSSRFPTTFENFWVTKSGERRRIAWTSSAIVGKSGALEFVVATGIDITTRRQAEEALEYRIEFERLITTISTNFINLPLENIDHGLDIALGIIGEFAGVDRSYVFLYSADDQSMSNTHEWCAPDIEAMRDRLQDLPTDSLPWFDERIRRLETVYAPRVADLPEAAAAEKAEWQYESIQSLICVPMVCGGAPIGFVGFDSVRSQKDWPNDIVALLRIVGDIFANALARKRAKEELARTVVLLRNVLDSTPDMVFAKDPESRLLICNTVFAAAIGKAPAELTGYTDIESGWDPELVRGNPQKGIRGYEDDDRDALSGKHVHNPRDPANVGGEMRIFDTHKLPLRDGEGKIIGLLGVARDVTEHRRAEEALRESEERFRQLAENTNQVLWLTDWKKRELLYVSPAYERIWGRSCQSLYEDRKSWLEVIHPEERSHVAEAFAKAAERGEYVEAEYRIVRDDGSVRWVRDRAYPILDEHGQPSRFVSLADDITEKKQAEESLRQSEERFRAIADYTYDWENWFGPDGKLLWINPAVKRVIGYTAEECLAMPGFPVAVMHEDDREWVAEVFRGAVERNTSGSDFVFRWRHKDGHAIWGAVSWQPIFNSEGVCLGHRSSIRDVTERKRTEEALRRADRLAGLGTMVAGVAHELNNPLMAISGLSELLAKKSGRDRKTAQLAEEISAQSIRCGQIVEDLLGFARARSVRRRAVQVNDVIRRCLERARHDARFRDIDIAEDLSPDIPPTLADRYRLEQVFINIIRNAGDALAGDRTAKRFEVCTRRSDGEIRIEFTDNGPGIEQPDKIFDPFYSTRGTGEGTGLGLSVSFGIVEEHGGRIAARNLDTGACITVHLPIHPAPGQ